MTTMGHLSVWRWKDVLLGACLFCNFDIYIFFSFVLFICLYVFLYILSKVIDEAKCEVESVFHLWQSASLLLRGGGSVLHCLCYDLSTDLFPLACPSYCHTVTGETCTSSMISIIFSHILYIEFVANSDTYEWFINTIMMKNRKILR